MSKAIFEYVTKLAEQLSFEEREKLIEHLRQPSATKPAAAPASLYGVWRGKFPEDVDIDATLKEIRGEWQKEWSDGEFNG